MTDNRTAELTAMERFRTALEKRGIEFETNDDECAEGEERMTLFKANLGESEFDIFVTAKDWYFDGKLTPWLDVEFHNTLTPEQAIAATLGKPKARAHPYGYEPDTGAFDATRCECGCVNDISATYCNDCGGEIEIDMNAEKEIYRTPRHLVFAKKHDDGSLEFCERRYVPEDAATLGGGKLTAEQVRDVLLIHLPHREYYSVEQTDAWQAIADELNAVIGNDGSDVDDALALLDEIREAGRITYDDYSQLHDEISVLGSGTCEWLPVESCHSFAGPGWECSSCGHEVGEYEHDFYNCCPICCAKVRKAVKR